MGGSKTTKSKVVRVVVITAVVLVGGLLLANAALQWRRSRVTHTFTGKDPSIRWWWGDVPRKVRDAALETGDLSNIRPDDYVGPQVCADCHQENHAKWQQHRHRWMNAPANDATVVGDFSGTAGIDFYGGHGSFFRDGDHYMMRLVRGKIDRLYHITQTIGSRFTQYYVGIQVAGPEKKPHPLYETEHVLPFGFWIDRRKWIPIVHVGETRSLGEPSSTDERRRDPFGDPACVDYTDKCSRCHTTPPIGDWLLQNATKIRHSPRKFDIDMLSYLADAHPDLLENNGGGGRMSPPQIQSLIRKLRKKKVPVWQVTSGITCEACHNGCRYHTEDSEKLMPGFFPVSPSLHLAGKDQDRILGRTAANKNWTCARCHTGNRFEFAGGMATWNSVEYSDAMKGGCYKPVEGRPQLTCDRCHDPHATIGQRWPKTPKQDDASCLTCHSQYKPAEARAAHTHHPSDTSGSRCMNCHMPRINEGLQDVVRTHTIFSPTHTLMIESNQPNACNMCHVDKSIDWTLKYLKQWYDRDYSSQKIAENYDAQRRSGPATIGWLESWHATTQMVASDALTRANARWALPQLIKMLDSPYLIDRQFTLIGLEKMLDVKLSDYGYEFYMFKDDRLEPLKAIWADFLADGTPFPERAEPVERRIWHYEQMIKFKPDSFRAHYDLATIWLSKGNTDAAVTHFRQSVQINPEFVLGYIELGRVLSERGSMDLAIRQYREGLRNTPKSASLHNALGSALGNRGSFDKAIVHFRKAVSIKPDFEEARNNLETALRIKGQHEGSGAGQYPGP